MSGFAEVEPSPAGLKEAATVPAAPVGPEVVRYQRVKAVLEKHHADGVISTEKLNELLEKALEKMVEGVSSELIAPAKDKEDVGVAQFFRQQREEELEPWKRRRCWAQRHISSILPSGDDATKTLQARRRQFFSEAEAGLLSPTEVFLARYTLFTEDVAREHAIMLGILQNMNEVDRLPLHNWLIFEDMEPMERERYGPVIDELTVPLFPVWKHPSGERLQALNKKILSEAMERRMAAGHVSGGRPPACGAGESLFRKDRTLFGGGYQAPVYDSEGKQVAAVDLSDLEAFLGDLSRRVDELRQEERAVGSAVLGELRTGLKQARGNHGGLRNQKADLQRLRQSINRYMPRSGSWQPRGNYRGGGEGGSDGGQVFGGGEAAPKN